MQWVLRAGDHRRGLPEAGDQRLASAYSVSRPPNSSVMVCGPARSARKLRPDARPTSPARRRRARPARISPASAGCSAPLTSSRTTASMPVRELGDERGQRLLTVTDRQRDHRRRSRASASALRHRLDPRVLQRHRRRPAHDQHVADADRVDHRDPTGPARSGRYPAGSAAAPSLPRRSAGPARHCRREDRASPATAGAGRRARPRSGRATRSRPGAPRPTRRRSASVRPPASPSAGRSRPAPERGSRIADGEDGSRAPSPRPSPTARVAGRAGRRSGRRTRRSAGCRSP